MYIIHEDNKPRLQWRLAVVKDLIEGKDGQIHAARIRTSKRKKTRPVAKLYPLEVHSEESRKQNGTTVPEDIEQSVNDMSKDNQQNKGDADITHVRTMRAASSKALQKMKEWSGIFSPPPEDV